MLKNLISEYLAMRSIRKHRSRLGWRDAPRYSAYLDDCRHNTLDLSVLTSQVASVVSSFQERGFADFQTPSTESVANRIYTRILEREACGDTLWREEGYTGQYQYVGDLWRDFPELEDLFNSELSAFLTSYFKSHYKIYYGAMYRSIFRKLNTGSRLWHSDSGPGTCVNVMLYLHPTDLNSGTLEVLDWESSLKIYAIEKRAVRDGTINRYGGTRRDKLCELYNEVISRSYTKYAVKPIGGAGLVVPFLNNTLHRGGHPEAGHQRTAIVFHCYPSHRPTDLKKYKSRGVAKTAPYPQDPAEDF